MVYVLWVISCVVIWYIYHSTFSVMYFKGGCLSEIIGIAIVGAVVTELIMSYWIIAIPVIIIVLVYAMSKNKK